MSERQLVTIETIREITPIPKADAIEAVKVRGWTVVVKKDEFAVGDQVLYFEIDSALPVADHRFAFLAPRGTKTLPDGTVIHRLKTAKLRGQYSQGLVMPVSDFPELTGIIDTAEGPGLDLAERIGVTLYEPPLPAGTNITGEFPRAHARKTVSERAQNLQDHWQMLHDKGTWIATEKVDGLSLTVVKTLDADVLVAMRNYTIEPGTGAHGTAVKEADLVDLMAPGEVLQGEIAGEGIRGNPLGLTGKHIVVFNYTRDGQPLAQADWPAWISDPNTATMVRPVPIYTDLQLPTTADAAVELVDGIKSLITPGRLAEGIVWYDVSHHPDVTDVLNDRNTIKTISNKFLLKHDS